MSIPEEQEAEVVLAEATVGADGAVNLSVGLEKTEEEEPTEANSEGGGSVVGDLVGGAVKAAGGVLKAAGSVLGGLTSSSGDSGSSDDS